jgi:hypothetical protein
MPADRTFADEIVQAASSDSSQSATSTRERIMRHIERVGEREEELKHERRLAEERKGPAAEKITWLGTDREFGDWILHGSAMTDDAKAKGLIDGRSDWNKLTQVCKHFVGKDGKALVARNIWQNLKNRENFER